ncbi:MAG: MFS transporter, partial [Faecalibacillus sp.]
MGEKSENISVITMLVFIVMNFILSMSGTLFNGILDKIALDMNISIAQTGYLTSLYAYGAIGAPIILIVLRKISQSRLLKGMLFLDIIFGVLSITTTNFMILLLSRFMLGLVGTTYNVLATITIASLSNHNKVGKNLSLLITGSAVALMIGVPLCRVLISHYSWQSIYFVLILFMILGLVYFVFCLPRLKQKNTSLNIKAELSLFKDKNVMMVVISSLITFIGYGAFYTYITPYIVEVFPSLES